MRRFANRVHLTCILDAKKQMALYSSNSSEGIEQQWVMKIINLGYKDPMMSTVGSTFFLCSNLGFILQNMFMIKVYSEHKSVALSPVSVSYFRGINN